MVAGAARRGAGAIRWRPGSARCAPTRGRIASEQPPTPGERAESRPAAQLALLDLQELDSRADLLRHQRASLPELAEIAALQASRAELDDQRRDAQIVVDDLTAEQRKVDADVEQVKARRTRDQQRMDQGLITNPKDLERMQGELESLQRRITSLEDDELEVMARLEDAQSDLDSLTAQVAAADERLADLAAARDEKTAELDAELGEPRRRPRPGCRRAARGPARPLRQAARPKGGVGAAAAARPASAAAAGSRSTPPSSAVIRATADDEVVRCEECQRILVRTPESGL